MIDDKCLKEVCKMGQGNDCCAFLTVGPNGIQCAKGTELEGTIRQRTSKMVARSDNCDGYKGEDI